MPVPARISLVTLGVRDLAASTAFYSALGWPLAAASNAAVSFFVTAGGLLGLFPTNELAADAMVPERADDDATFRGVTVSINVGSREETDAAMSAAVAAGGRLVKAPQATDWGGYSGYFADPDGHLWEIAHNPFWPLGDDGLPHLE